MRATRTAAALLLASVPAARAEMSARQFLTGQTTSAAGRAFLAGITVRGRLDERDSGFGPLLSTQEHRAHLRSARRVAEALSRHGTRQRKGHSARPSHGAEPSVRFSVPSQVGDHLGRLPGRLLSVWSLETCHCGIRLDDRCNGGNDRCGGDHPCDHSFLGVEGNLAGGSDHATVPVEQTGLIDPQVFEAIQAETEDALRPALFSLWRVGCVRNLLSLVCHAAPLSIRCR